MEVSAKQNRLACCQEVYDGDVERMHRDHFFATVDSIPFEDLVAGRVSNRAQVLKDEFGGDKEAMWKEHFAYALAEGWFEAD